MPKRIYYAPTIEGMSGDLSAPQKLEYARRNNQAYESPMNQRNYARNYRGSIIARRLTQTGRNIFAIKGRSAVGMTTKSQRAMALLAGTGAIYGHYIKTASFTQMQSNFRYAVEHGYSGSFRKYWFDVIYLMLDNQEESRTSANAGGEVTFVNPWVATTGAANIVKISVLVRYWTVLANRANTFTVNGRMGVYHSGDKFADIINSHYNVLELVNDNSKVTWYGKQVYGYYGNEWHEVPTTLDPVTGANKGYTTNPQL